MREVREQMEKRSQCWKTFNPSSAVCRRPSNGVIFGGGLSGNYQQTEPCSGVVRNAHQHQRSQDSEDRPGLKKMF